MRKDVSFFRAGFEKHLLSIGLIFLVLFTVLLSGCKHRKEIAKTPQKQDTIAVVKPPMQPTPAKNIDPNVAKTLQQLQKNQLVFKELSARLKTKVKSPDLNQSFTTNIRWKKGEKIWLSMSIIGIEGVRVLITKDSIKVMDRLNDRYILKPISYIKQKALIDLSFTDIENLLLGQLLFTDTANTKFADNPANITLTSNSTRFLNTIIFNKPSQFLSSMFVTDKINNQTLTSSYTNYQTQLNKQFSMERNLVVKSKGETFEMQATFQAIKAEQGLDYPFPIKSGYKIEK